MKVINRVAKNGYFLGYIFWFIPEIGHQTQLQQIFQVTKLAQ